MDIKTRIDGLSEQEAKAALEWFFKYATDITGCNSCPFESGCPEVGVCKSHFLDEALKEARHERI